MPTFLTFGLHLDESDVRRLCGDATFVRSDLLQRHGHVEAPRVNANVLAATVRGTWRRRYHPEATAQGNRVVPNCDCAVGGFCQHVGALLLQWLRQRDSFATASTSSPYAERSRLAMALAAPSEHEFLGDTIGAAESAEQELARRLDVRTVADLRELAVVRGVALPRSHGKAAVVVHVSRALAEPASVDAALSGLSADERLGLDAAYLVGSGGTVGRERAAGRNGQSETIRAAHRALGGGELNPLPRLLTLGLILDEEIMGRPLLRFGVPGSVQDRLWPIDETFAPLKVQRRPANEPPALPLRDLRFEELLTIVGKALQKTPVRSRVFESPGAWLSEGWTVIRTTVESDEPSHARRTLGLLPGHTPASSAELETLEERTGLPAETIEFTLELALALGLVEPLGRMALREDRWHEFLSLAPAVRADWLIAAWLNRVDWTVLSSLFGSDGELALYYRPDYITSLPILHAEVRALSRLVTRLVRRLRPDTWYAADDLLQSIRPLLVTRDLGLRIVAPVTAGDGGPLRWWIAERGRPDTPLDLAVARDWTRFHGALVETLLSGPLFWLGLVDLAPTNEGTTFFRPRRVVGRAARESDALETPKREAPTVPTIDADLTVRVPVGTDDPALQSFLARAAVLLGYSPSELRYQLTPDRALALFDAGDGGPEVIEFLAARASVSDAARAGLERWWKGYGASRLYDDLTLIELGDDLLLDELRATTSLSTSVLYVFSPRCIAVDSRAAGDLQAELARLGYAPRVVEEA